MNIADTMQVSQDLNHLYTNLQDVYFFEKLVIKVSNIVKVQVLFYKN